MDQSRTTRFQIANPLRSDRSWRHKNCITQKLRHKKVPKTCGSFCWECANGMSLWCGSSDWRMNRNRCKTVPSGLTTWSNPRLNDIINYYLSWIYFIFRQQRPVTSRYTPNLKSKAIVRIDYRKAEAHYDHLHHDSFMLHKSIRNIKCKRIKLIVP